RWQRRWFVLYDDGELTYSVDEHPETIPQAIIDMTKVLEVTTADNITSHPHSIAITAPDRVTFVKGTCPEESKWWFNVLVAFPKSKGRHKRNATFPGGQATTILQAQSNIRCETKLANRDHHLSNPSVRGFVAGLSLVRFASHYDPGAEVCVRKTATTDLEFTRGTTRSGSGPGTPQEHGGGLIVRQDMHLKYVAVGDPGGCREGNNKTRHLTSDCMFY
ncbi:AGAP009848-PA, partial [Anopheles gambiae str. PEST]